MLSIRVLKRNAFWILLIACGLSVAEVGFRSLEKLNTTKIELVIRSLFSDDMSVTPYELAKKISDLEKLQIIKCVNLSIVGGREYYDTRYRKVCRDGIVSRASLSTQIQAVNGIQWKVDFKIVKNSFYWVSLTLLRLSIVVTIFLAFFYFRFLLKLEEERNLRQKEIDKSIGVLARKVAHDIRSPLSALKILVKTSQELPESKRRLLTMASERIESITNNLLKQPKENMSRWSPQLEMIDPIADAILREKGIEFQNKKVRFIKGEWQGAFSKIDKQSLKSTISNLINNAVEAGANQVKFELLSRSQVELKITDNGSGIPAKVLEKLGKEQVTTKSSGHGIGLSSAFATVKSWGGDIKIESESGKGTSITIQLPKAKAPEWYVPRIDLWGHEGIVVCDDDDSVHGLFDQLLPSHEVIHFSSVSDFSQNSSRFSGYLIFMDNEFQGEKLRGIDVVPKLPNSILMSGNMNDELMDLVQKKKAKFIPKSCLPSLKIVPGNDAGVQTIQLS